MRLQRFTKHPDADGDGEHELEIGKGLDRRRLGHLIALDQQPMPRRPGDAKRAHQEPVARGIGSQNQTPTQVMAVAPTVPVQKNDVAAESFRAAYRVSRP